MCDRIKKSRRRKIKVDYWCLHLVGAKTFHQQHHNSNNDNNADYDDDGGGGMMISKGG